MGEQKWMTEEEREEVAPNEYFMGCYFASGYTSYMWNKVSWALAVDVLAATILFAPHWFRHERPNDHNSHPTILLAHFSTPTIILFSRDRNLVSSSCTCFLTLIS